MEQPHDSIDDRTSSLEKALPKGMMMMTTDVADLTATPRYEFRPILTIGSLNRLSRSYPAVSSTLLVITCLLIVILTLTLNQSKLPVTIVTTLVNVLFEIQILTHCDRHLFSLLVKRFDFWFFALQVIVVTPLHVVASFTMTKGAEVTVSVVVTIVLLVLSQYSTLLCLIMGGDCGVTLSSRTKVIMFTACLLYFLYWRVALMYLGITIACRCCQF